MLTSDLGWNQLFRKIIWQPERPKHLIQALRYLNIYILISTSPLLLLSTFISSTPPCFLIHLFSSEWWCGLRFVIQMVNRNLFLLNTSCSFHPNPWSSSSSSSSSSSWAVLVSWDSSLTDRQADGSDTSNISRIQQNNVDGNQWRQWQRGRGGLEEKTGEESEWKGKQGDRERAVAQWRSSLRERCRLQIRQTHLQAQYRPESEGSTLCFLPAQCPDMSYVCVVFSVFPVVLLLMERARDTVVWIWDSSLF